METRNLEQELLIAEKELEIAYQNRLEAEKAIEPILKTYDEKSERVNKLEQEIIAIEKNKHIDLVQLAEDYEVYNIYLNSKHDDSFRDSHEDDGTLHITIGKLRFCFICNQDLSKSDWMQEAKPILKAFGFKYSELNK